MGIWRQLYYRFLRPPSTNYNLQQLSYNFFAELPQGACVLDVGSKSAGGKYAVFADEPRADLHIFALDIARAKGVSLIADAHRLPCKSAAIDGVLCISVLEYVSHPQRVVDESYRVLKPGGLFYINVPFVFRYAPDPDDLYRFSMSGLRVLCGAFEEIQVGYNRGPASTMSDLLVHFCAILFCCNSKKLYSAFVEFFQWSFFWIKYFDRWIGNYKFSHILCNGVFFLGRKPLERE